MDETISKQAVVELISRRINTYKRAEERAKAMDIESLASNYNEAARALENILFDLEGIK